MGDDPLNNLDLDTTAEAIELRDPTGVSQFLSDTAAIDGYGEPAADD